MQKDFKGCQMIGHERNEVTYICTYKQCQQAQRLMCEECVSKQLHNHRSQIKLDQFVTHLNNYTLPKVESQKKEAQKISQFIKELQNIIQQIHNIIEQYENYQQHSKAIDKASKQANKNIKKLNNQELNNLINIDEGNIDYIQIQNNIQRIIVQLQDLNKEFVKISFVPQKDIKIQDIRSPSVSQNEKYLSALVGKKFQIINMSNNKTVMNKLKRQPTIVRFSQDSQFIFVGDIVGIFKQFSNKRSFKQIYSKLIHTHIISDLLEIDRNQIIIAQYQIGIIDLMRRRQLLKINNSTYAYCLEFDRINNLIIAVFEEKIIRFFDRNNGNLVMSKSYGNQKKIYQVQLINQSQNLLGCDKYSLKLWQVDYQKKKLNLIKEFNYDVHYFKAVYQDQRIIIRNKNQLIITDIDFNIIYETQIKGQNFDHSYKFDQLQSMSYIIIQDKADSLKILKKENKQRQLIY